MQQNNLLERNDHTLKHNSWNWNKIGKEDHYSIELLVSGILIVHFCLNASCKEQIVATLIKPKVNNRIDLCGCIKTELFVMTFMPQGESDLHVIFILLFLQHLLSGASN